MSREKITFSFYRPRAREYLIAFGEKKLQGSAMTLDKKEIHTGGLHGEDHLVKTTRDGWTLAISTPKLDDKSFDNYLIRKIYLVSPGEQQKILVCKHGPCELRAFGFSDTEKPFIVALSCELIIYSRS